MKRLVNPYLPSFEYMPDGEPHVFDGRLYVFGSHDKFKGRYYCENDYTCWSAPVEDLSDWRCEGIIYRRVQDPTPKGLLKTHMWAPDVCRGADGRYYLYYALEWYNRIAVAVAQRPSGPYEYYGEVHYADGTRYGGKSGERLRFDPAVLHEDGVTYLYSGFSSSAMRVLEFFARVRITAEGSTVVRLKEDMLTIEGDPKQLLPGTANSTGTGFEGHEFYEAMSMRKFGGRYYAVYSSVLSHELCYAVSDRPDGGFRFGGALHSNGNIFDGSPARYYWGNNHGGIECVNGNYYIFGHRQTGRNEASRQGIAELLLFVNGEFYPAEMTSCGLYGKPLPAEGEYEAGIACELMSREGACKVTRMKGSRHPYITQEGADRECNPAQYIANFCDGCVAGFKYFLLPGGGVNVSVFARGHKNRRARGVLHVACSEDFSDAAVIDVNVKGRTELHCSLMECGKFPLYIRYCGKGALDLLYIRYL